MKLHNDGKDSYSFECEFCFKVSQRKDKYDIHLNSHAKSEGNPYLCNACGSQFAEKAQLTNHIMLHGNWELYFVREFKMTHPSAASNQNSTEIPSFVYVCQLCKKEFKDWMSLQEHLCRHFGGNLTLNCETCGKKFDEKEDFLKHQDHHLSDDVVKCDVCWKVFDKNADLITHRHIHNVVSTPVQRSKLSIDGEFKTVDVSLKYTCRFIAPNTIIIQKPVFYEFS